MLVMNEITWRKKRHRSRMKTPGCKYPQGMAERGGTKTGDGEGVSEVPRKTTTVCCPRTLGGESSKKGSVNQQTDSMAR